MADALSHTIIDENVKALCLAASSGFIQAEQSAHLGV
jgi:hypothetical protein